MILDSGSVKLRCAFGLGFNGSRPPGGRGFVALLQHLRTTRRLRLVCLCLQRFLGRTDHRKALLATLQLLG